jgi:transposase
LANTLDEISGKSTLAAAIRYALSRWSALTHYTTDGRLGLATTRPERAIRPLALCRNNYQFAGPDAGGIRAAAMYYFSLRSGQ